MLAVGYALCAGLPARAGDPPKLDEKELADIRGNLSSWESLSEWPALKRRGEKVLPYFAHILADEKRTNRQVVRAFIFTRNHLTEYDCKMLVEPAVGLFMHQDQQIRAEAVWLLRLIGNKQDAPSVTMMLDDEWMGARKSAAICLGMIGGKHELLALDLWIARKGAEKDEAFDEVKKSRDKLRERLEKEAKANPVEPTKSDEALAQFADADAKVRAVAVESLKKVGSKADSTAVVALLHDPDATVRTAAAEWLGALGGKRELLALEIRIREPKATDDEAFDAMVKSKRAVAERVEAEEKKANEKDADK